MNNAQIQQHYTSAKSRIFLMDYDGTLAPIATMPQDAVPTAELKELLRTLAGDPANTVVIITGRDHQTLDAWLGDLPLSFAAEHGFLYKTPGSLWESVGSDDVSWKEPVRASFEQAIANVPGSHIEEKDMALVWHYRTATDQSAAETELNRLREIVANLCMEHGLRAIYGNKVIEIQPTGVDKGIAAQHWLSAQEYGFILAAGDDTTDEDLLKACPPEAITVKVGDGESVARTHYASPAEFTALLAELASQHEA